MDIILDVGRGAQLSCGNNGQLVVAVAGSGRHCGRPLIPVSVLQ